MIRGTEFRDLENPYFVVFFLPEWFYGQYLSWTKKVFRLWPRMGTLLQQFNLDTMVALTQITPKPARLHI